jgi:hypothetical protein
LKDGWSGSGLVDDLSIADTDTTLEVDTLASTPEDTTIIPVGVRFTIDTVTAVTFTITAVNNNEQQEIDLDTPSAGNFTLTFDGEGPTGSILWNATAGTVQTALELLANIDSGDIEVTGTAPVFIVEYKGQYLDTDVALMTIQDVDLVDAGSEAITVLHVGGISWELTFTPALVSGNLPANDDVITYLPQELEIKIGDGNLTYTEANEYEYDLDRGVLDSVRAGDQVPLDLNLDFVYEYITTGTAETISPMDALKGIGGASGWVSSSADGCEPYAVDVEVVHTPICTTQEIETTVFPDFRSESREPDLGEASVSVSGRCNVVQPTVTRSAHP